MENTQRDLEKELARLSSPKPSRKKKRWTLVFIGDHGKTLSIKGYKGYAYLIMLTLFVAVLSSVVFYYLYRENERVKKKLERDLNIVRDQIISIRKEKDVLMARLVVAESNLKTLARDKEGKPAQNVSRKVADSPPPQAKPEKPPPVAELVKPPQHIKEPPPEKSIQKKAEEKKAEAPVQPDPAPPVSIEKLQVFYELNSKTYRAQFILRNTNYDSDPISGYTAVVLKNHTMGPDEGLTLPRLKLVSGKPAGNRRGQYFAIARFKMVKFKMVHHSDPKQYDTARIFVFDADKNLLLEQNFPIRLEEVSAVAND